LPNIGQTQVPPPLLLFPTITRKERQSKIISFLLNLHLPGRNLKPRRIVRRSRMK
jgi:hypothetical protein